MSSSSWNELESENGVAHKLLILSSECRPFECSRQLGHLPSLATLSGLMVLEYAWNVHFEIRVIWP